MRWTDRQLPRVLPLIGLLAACGPPAYQPPSVGEPHANVTVRVVHHEVPGPDLAHQTLVDGRRVSVAGRTAVVQGAPFTRSVRVRPGPREWRFRSQFSHWEHRMETVYETERYACGTQTTGYGRSSRRSTRYCTRQVPRQRMRRRRVIDGECDEHLLQTAGVDRQYVVQFDYHASGQCRARCFEQTPLPGARFSLRPCSLGPAPVTTAGGARSVSPIPRSPAPPAPVIERRRTVNEDGAGRGLTSP